MRQEIRPERVPQMTGKSRAFRRSTRLLAVCITVMLPVLSWADERPRDLKQWIERLDSPRFSDRQDATLKLRNLGVSAIDALEDVSRQFDEDAANRALSVLESHFSGDDAILSHESKQALQRIAGDPTHRKASAAKNILAPKDDSIDQRPAIRRMIPALNRGMQIRVNGAIQIKGGGGKKEISINHNGKKFRFVEDKNGIEVQRPDGNGGMKKSTYKDLKELKKKDPESHRMYGQFSGNGNGFRIQVGGAPKPAKP